MAAWKDATTFSQGQTDRTPNTWVCKLGMWSLFVTRDHLYYKGEWAFGMPGVIEASSLELPLNANPITAQAKAIGIARRVLTKALEAANA